MQQFVVNYISIKLHCLTLILLGIFLFSTNAAGSDISVSAKISSEKFTTQQPAQLKVLVEGTQRAEVEPPEVDGLIFHERGKSSQFRLINGALSSSITFSYLLQGLTPGSYVIPGFTVSIKDETLKTNTINCEVLDPQANQPQGTSTNPDVSSPEQSNQKELAFIEFEIDRTEAFVGETIPTKVTAFFDRRARVNLNSLPQLSGSGVLADPFSNTPEQREVVIDGAPYISATWHTFLTPIKEGSHSLSIALDATMLVPSRRRSMGTNMLEDDIFSNIFAQYENRPVRIISPPIPLSSHPLPEKGKPDGFSGAIGTFSLESSAEPRKITQGDPITLSMSIRGSGNFTSVNPPTLLSEDGLKVYSPQITFTPENNPHTGTKRFDQALVVTDPSITQIPKVVFSYFDPKKRAYQTIMSEPIPIEQELVQAPPPAPMSPPTQTANNILASASTDRMPAEGFQPISRAPLKLIPGKTVSEIVPSFRQPLFLTTLGGLATLFLLITALRVRTWYLDKNPSRIRQAQIKREKQQVIEYFATIGHRTSRDYFSTTKHKLQNLLGFIWDCHPQSITTADVVKKLGEDSAIAKLFIETDRRLYTNDHDNAPPYPELTDNIISAVKTL